MVAFRIGAVLGAEELELADVTEFELEANWPPVFVGFEIAFEDADGPGPLAVDDKLADML